jgi:hypothetical protein
MDDIENACVLFYHTPTFSWQWLKDKILNEIPHVKSVMQKIRRMPAVLYYPTARDEYMVHSVLTSDSEDMNIMKTEFTAAQTIWNAITLFKRKNSANMIAAVSDITDVTIELYSLIRWTIVWHADE